MIDLHSHLLPGIDDGSESLNDSVQHLELISNQGITDLFLTSHYMKGTFETNKEIFESKYLLLKEATSHLNIRLHLGAECYLYEGLVADIFSQDLFLGNTKYVLFETSMADKNFIPEFDVVRFEMLNKGIKPILAHPERYRPIIDNPNLAEDLINKDVYLQINAGSLLGDYGSSVMKTAWYLLQKGYAHFLGSDTHCRKDYYPYRLAVDLIRKEIDDYTADLLSIINPRKLLDNEHIDLLYLEDFDFYKEENLFKRILNKVLNRNG